MRSGRAGLSGLYSRDNLSRLSKAEPLRALLSFVLRLEKLEHHFQKSKNVPIESQRENYRVWGRKFPGGGAHKIQKKHE